MSASPNAPEGVIPFTLGSVAFAVAGYGAGRVGISWYGALLAAAAFETIQDSLAEVYGAQLAESRTNVMIDLVVFMSGFAVAERGRR